MIMPLGWVAICVVVGRRGEEEEEDDGVWRATETVAIHRQTDSFQLFVP